MAISKKSFFWTGKSSEGAYGDAGPYNQETFTKFIKALFAERSGVLSGLIVTENSPTSKSVLVGTGMATVRGLFRVVQAGDADQVLTFADNTSGNPRIDRVVVRADWSTQEVTLAVKQGTPAASPVAPSLTQTEGVIWEEGIADVAIADGFLQLVNANITDTRLYAEIVGRAYQVVVNKSGGALVVGDVVVWDDTNQKSVKTTTTADDPQVAGVVAEAIASNAEGRICTAGLHPVNVGAAVGIGNVLCTHTVAKQATNQGANSFGRAVKARSDAGLVLALVLCRAIYPAYAVSRATIDASPSTGFGIINEFTLSNVVTHGGPLRINLNLHVTYASGAQFGADVKVDGVYVGQTTFGKTVGLMSTSAPTFTGTLTMINSITERIPLAAGTHTIELWVRSTTGGATVKGATYISRLEVIEELR